MSQPLGKNRGENANRTLGDLSGVPLTDELFELLQLWEKLSDERKELLLTGLRAAVRDAPATRYRSED
ncbi:hypothetical protein [uncultured Gimesia sp.]|uniref:hypothetical protein n=1 Tax=uncultured Gimesia sp. TaxID=1678688 RepID=UPI002608C102|nr:hypothetical protein [uncultured Gimesia sp.]